MADQAVAYALTTAARVKARISITDTGFDTVLVSYINAITAYIESACDTRFKRTTYTQEVYHIPQSGRRYLPLKHAPVVTLSALQYKAGMPSNPGWTDFLVDNYELLEDGKTGMIMFYTTIPHGINMVRATYSAGYLIDFTKYGDETLHTLPYELTELAERLVIKRFKKRDEEGKSQVAFGGGTTTWASFLDEDDKDILAGYTRSTQFV